MVSIKSLILLASTALAQTCYYPAGNIASGDVACSSSGTSHCCSSQDMCLDNGLCRVNSDPETTEYARGSCTDQNWGPGCLQYCIPSHPGSFVTSAAAIYQCNSTGWTDPAGSSYCCEQSINQKTGCCTSGASQFWLPAGGAPVQQAHALVAVASSSSSVAPSTSSVASSSVVSSSSSSAAVTSVSSSSSTSSSSSSYSWASNSTSSVIAGTGSAPAPTNGTVSTGPVPTQSPTGPSGPSGPSGSTPTGAASAMSVGFGAVVLAVGAWIVL